MSAKFTPVRRLCTRIASFWSKRRVFGQARITYELLAPIHHRMPVILPATARRLWLGEEKAEPTNRSASSDHPAELMRAYPDHEPALKMIPNY